MTLPYAQMFSGNMVIYRETNIADNFEKLAEVPMTDCGYTPDIQSNRYMITLPTTYGMESLPSDIHRTTEIAVINSGGSIIHATHPASAGILYSKSRKSNKESCDTITSTDDNNKKSGQKELSPIFYYPTLQLYIKYKPMLAVKTMMIN